MALLIGNGHYRTAEALFAVKNDILAFKAKLQKLDFRVYAFLDLDLQEMKTAITSFKMAMSAGTYGASDILFFLINFKIPNLTLKY